MTGAHAAGARRADGMVSALAATRDALEELRLPLELPGVEEQRAVRRQLVEQVDDYVLPRFRQIDAPLLAVVGGSTGAGKSTLVNSLVGARVSEAGVLRPTTRSAVLVHHPDDAAWFGAGRILPDLARTTGDSADPGSLRLVATAAVPQGLAILDAPDIDSVERANRVLATQLLASADLWLFVTSAARYADQVPWQLLAEAAERSAALAIVLDRTPPAAADEVAGHLARMLSERGLGDTPMFVVAEVVPDENGLLDDPGVDQVRAWLAELAADASARAAVVRQTLDGAVRGLSRRAYELADAQEAQLAMAARLRKDVDRAYEAAVAGVATASADGTLLRGEVLARWQEFVGTGELFRSLETKVGWLRDRVTGWFRGKPQQAERVTVAVESGLETLILGAAENAAEETVRSWQSVEAGTRLLAGAPQPLDRASRELRPATERAVRDWQAGVLQMVREEGAERRSTARFLAFGVNGLAVALMVVVFASTTGLTGAEVGIAGGSAVLGQKLLEAVFGDDAVRRLADRARTDLTATVAALVTGERARYTDLLDALGLHGAEDAAAHAAAPAGATAAGPGHGEPVRNDPAARLRDAVRALDDARSAHQAAPGPDQAGDRPALRASEGSPATAADRLTDQRADQPTGAGG